MKDLIVGTAGHIDHGKTALVQALTGINADRLQEEQRRGITIDIGFAHLELGPYRVGFIDVPGHERFVKNMLAGIGGIQLVMLVVAADESVMPQTVEHFQICRLLEIPRGIVVLTKRDLVDEELLLVVEEEVRELTAGSFLETAPVVAVDSLSGRGIDQLRQTLLREIEALAQRSEDWSEQRIFRLSIDRVFSVRGFGTVVTGSPYSGTVGREDPVAVFPSGKTGKIRGIETFKEKVDRAGVGQRTALNLTGLERQDLERGMVLAAPGSVRPSSMLDVRIEVLPDPGVPLKHRSPIRFHHGSAELLGRIYLLEERALEPGRPAWAQIRLQAPAVCMPGDHFVLRRYSPLTTIGGGIVLDNSPPKHRRRDLSHLLPRLAGLYDAFRAGPEQASRALVRFLVERRKAAGVDLSSLVQQTGLKPECLLRLVEGEEDLVVVPQDPPLLVARSHLDQLARRLVEFVGTYQQEHPLSPGVPREELKERFLNNGSNPYFQFLLARLEKEQKLQSRGSVVTLFGKEIQLEPEQEEIRGQLLSLVEEAAFQPPTLEELTAHLPYPPEKVRQLYFFLIQQGSLVKISEGIVVSARQLERLKERLQKEFPPGSPFTVPQFKQLFDISRKYAIPYLEYLDRNRVTRRSGDERVTI